MAILSNEGAILFACTQNAVRSPMAAAMLRHLTRGRLYIESAGVKAGELDPLAVEAMAEIGLELGKH
jgi:protein-tyrosine-phosphatase